MAIADHMNREHKMIQNRINRHRKEDPIYNIGDLVLMVRPKTIGGDRLETYWTGPYPIVRREGERSFVIQKAPHREVNVHMDQLKPWIADWDPPGTGVPLRYNATHSEDPPCSVRQIQAHRRNHGEWEALIQWEGAPASEATWEPATSLQGPAQQQWRRYSAVHELPAAADER